MNTNAISRAHVTGRVLASLLGSYTFVWGFTGLDIAVGLLAGLRYEEAQTLAYLLSFIVLLVCFLWSIAASSLVRVWAVLVGGGALMSGVAWALANRVSV